MTGLILPTTRALVGGLAIGKPMESWLTLFCDAVFCGTSHFRMGLIDIPSMSQEKERSRELNHFITIKVTALRHQGGSGVKRKFITWQMKEAIISRAKSRCEICNKRVSTRKFERGSVSGRKRIYFHIDHIKPFRFGGTCTLDNLRLTCPQCNYRRNTKAETLKDEALYRAVSKP